MTANEIITEIGALPPDEQEKVVRFTRQLEGERQLSPLELGAIAAQMIHAPTKEAGDQLENEFVRGFYGKSPHA